MKQKDILFLLGSSCLIVFAWIGSNIYNAFVTSNISETLNVQIIPIESRFDTGTLQHLKNRAQVNPILVIGSPTIATETAEEVLELPPLEEKATQEAEIATDEASLESRI